jgi:hypothetical protein
VTVGPYWVLEYNEEEGYALVSGGQPTTRTPDGCVGGSGTYDAGLWIFTRQQQRDPVLVEKVRGLAKAQGFDVSVLKDVNQTADCPKAAMAAMMSRTTPMVARMTRSNTPRQVWSISPALAFCAVWMECILWSTGSWDQATCAIELR